MKVFVAALLLTTLTGCAQYPSTYTTYTPSPPQAYRSPTPAPSAEYQPYSSGKGGWVDIESNENPVISFITSIVPNDDCAPDYNIFFYFGDEGTRSFTQGTEVEFMISIDGADPWTISSTMYKTDKSVSTAWQSKQGDTRFARELWNGRQMHVYTNGTTNQTYQLNGYRAALNTAIAQCARSTNASYM